MAKPPLILFKTVQLNVNESYSIICKISTKNITEITVTGSPLISAPHYGSVNGEID